MKCIKALAAGAALFLSLGAAQAMTVVPEGNRSVEQPAVPGASIKRTKSTKSSFDAKYAKVLNLLQNDAKLRSKIKQVSAQYGISPLHMAGAIVGEHTYNVDAYDRLQTYYVKALAYVASEIKFEANGEKVSDFITRPQFDACNSLECDLPRQDG